MTALLSAALHTCIHTRAVAGAGGGVQRGHAAAPEEGEDEATRGVFHGQPSCEVATSLPAVLGQFRCSLKTTGIR